MRITTTAVCLFASLYLVGPSLMLCLRPWHLGDQGAKNLAWHDTRRAGLSPDPALHPRAVVQVFAARAWGIRGAVAEHTWIAVKPPQAAAYRIYQVKGWLPAEQGISPLAIETGVPDRYWMGSPPRLLLDLRGQAARPAIAGIAAAAAAYPHRNTYRLWPGPNSNTFTAWMARTVPCLAFEMPVTAVGKDYPAGTGLLAPTPSRTGWQLGLWGLAGIAAGGCLSRQPTPCPRLELVLTGVPLFQNNNICAGTAASVYCRGNGTGVPAGLQNQYWADNTVHGRFDSCFLCHNR